MARLGELLVASGIVTAEQADQGLRAQVMWGGRLGTNLVELGHLSLDLVTQYLARQHRLPAALARHFDNADRELQLQLSPATAERYAAVPLSRIGPQNLIGLASTDAIPPEGLAIIAAELGVATAQLIPAIAAELRIRYQLERVYKIPRPARFLRSRGKTIPPLPQFEIAPLVLDEADADDVVVVLPVDTSELPIVRPAPPAIDPAAEFDRAATLEDDLAIPAEPPSRDGRDRRTYIRTIADEPPERQALGRIAIRRVAIAPNATLSEATRAIRRSTDRDKVAELVVGTIDRFLLTCEAAILLVVRGEVAIGWKGFCRSGNQLPEIGVPLEQPGLVPRVVGSGRTIRSGLALSPIDQRLLESLGHAGGELVVVPVMIGDQVVCLIALVTTASDAQVASAESIASAAGAAFSRLMRDASR